MRVQCDPARIRDAVRVTEVLRSSLTASSNERRPVPEPPPRSRASAARALAGVPGDPFDAPGDPNRRAIVELVGHGGRSVQELADELPISRPAVSRHLRLLKDAGLVEEEPHGTRRIYRLQEHGVAAVREYLLQVWGDAGARFVLMAENTCESVAAG